MQDLGAALDLRTLLGGRTYDKHCQDWGPPSKEAIIYGVGYRLS